MEEDNPPQVAEEVVEEVAEGEDNPPQEAEEDRQTPQLCLTPDSAETPWRYSQEIERKPIASSLNSNATIWPISESRNSTLGSAKSSSLAPISKDPSSINGSTEQ